MPWNDKRPMSPHLQIYKLPLTAHLSVLHRGTGVVLFIGLMLLVGVLAVAANGADSWQGMHNVLSSGFGKLVLFGFIFSLYYHLCNGIRHLFWDIGKGLDLQEARRTGKLAIILSVLLTILTWLIT